MEHLRADVGLQKTGALSPGIPTSNAQSHADPRGVGGFFGESEDVKLVLKAACLFLLIFEGPAFAWASNGKKSKPWGPFWWS